MSFYAFAVMAIAEHLKGEGKKKTKVEVEKAQQYLKEKRDKVSLIIQICSRLKNCGL